jgi:hypothetical protein
MAIKKDPGPNNYKFDMGIFYHAITWFVIGILIGIIFFWLVL